jgi:hypothetical protein
MNDPTPTIGFLGTTLSFTLGQWNDLFGAMAGALTCVYLIWKLIKIKRDEQNKFKLCEGCPNPGKCLANQACDKKSDKPGTKSYKPKGK